MYKCISLNICKLCFLGLSENYHDMTRVCQGHRNNRAPKSHIQWILLVSAPWRVPNGSMKCTQLYSWAFLIHSRFKNTLPHRPRTKRVVVKVLQQQSSCFHPLQIFCVVWQEVNKLTSRGSTHVKAGSRGICESIEHFWTCSLCLSLDVRHVSGCVCLGKISLQLIDDKVSLIQ